MKKIINAIKAIIIRFRYEHLRNETHVSFHEDFNAITGKYDTETLGIKPLYVLYQPLFEEEKAALDQIIKSQYTALIDDLDRQRDSLYRGFADTVTAALHHYDPEIRQAAQKIHDILERYGNISHKTLNDESAAIEDLHTELLKQDNYAAVSALGLGNWLGQLMQVSRNLAGVMLNRIDEAAKRPDLHMRSIRKAVDKAFRGILDLLEALVRVKGEDTDKEYIAEVNALSEKYKENLAQEAGRRKPLHDLSTGDDCVIEPVDTQKYTERAITPLPVVHYRKAGQPTQTLTFTKDFTVTYKNNINVGMADLIIHGIGEYKGTKSTTFMIAR